MNSTVVLNCGQLVTLAGPARPRTGPEMCDLAIIPDGALIIREGRIARVGTRAEIEASTSEIAEAKEIEVIDAQGALVTPGFVDAHTHPVFAGNRAEEYEQRIGGVSYGEIAAAGGGIRSTVRRTRAATEGELLDKSLRYAEWFLRSGTTCIEAKSGYGLTLEDELKSLRVILALNDSGTIRTIPTFLGAHEVPDEYRANRQAYIRLVIEEMLPAVSGQTPATPRLAEYCDIFCEEAIFTLAETCAIMTRARSLGLGLRMHVDQLSNNGGADLAAELGATTADHLEQTDPDGIAALSRSKTQPVLLPGSVYALGLKKYADARAMIGAGLAVVIATDFNPGSSPTPSMYIVMSLACTQMRMLPAEALTAATINAAYSLGRGADLGSLEPGKLADFVIHDCAEYRELPYFFGVEHAKEVYLGGRCVHRRG